MTSAVHSPAALPLDFQLGVDSPSSSLAALSDAHSTPDSVYAADLLWPYDVNPDPEEVHDFIFHADDDAGFALTFDGDSDQPVGIAAPLDGRAPAADDTMPALAAEEEDGGAYNPTLGSLKGKRVVCQSACVQCRKAKSRCDGARPCGRCAMHGRGDECVDRPVEEIERGKQNRRRKVGARKVKSPSQPPTIAATASASPALSLPPQHSSSLPVLAAVSQPPVDQLLQSSPLSCFVPLDSVAARLSMGQSALLRQSIIDRVNRLCATRPADDPARCRFIRAVHLLLVKIADSITAAHFGLFINGQLPGPESRSGLATPLPPCLAMWSRPATRPLYIDWTVSPTVCDADQTTDEAPTVRIRTGLAARRAMESWERRQQIAEQQQQSTAVQLQDAAVQPIEEIFSCLGVADTVESNEPSSHANTATSRPLHACWCPVFSGVPLSSASSPVDADSLALPAPLPCVCFAATALPTAMIVNAAWERLFGYSQSELRLQLMRRGCAVMMQWYVADSWWSLHALLASHALTDKRHGYRVRAFVVVRTRWGTELPCMLDKSIVEEADGHSQAVTTITPLPQLAAHGDA